MSTTKRVSGDYRIVSVNKATGANVLIDTHTLELSGNLVVRGTSTEINVEQTTVEDPIITLGKNNTGALKDLGLEVVIETLTQGGPSQKAGLRWNSNLDRWEISQPYVSDPNDDPLVIAAARNSATWDPIQSGGAFTLFSDPSPTLSNTLDLNGQVVTSPNDIRLIAGSGSVEIGQNLKVIHDTSDPTTQPGFTIIYAKEMGTGGTGLYAACNDTAGVPVQEELVSRSKAIIFSIIF